jgi:hypothetical protein
MAAHNQLATLLRPGGICSINESNNATASASFSASGCYTFMVNVSDNVHAVPRCVSRESDAARADVQNISTRRCWNPGKMWRSQGFIITGIHQKNVIVRALGPT